MENPAWYEYLPKNESGQVVLDIPGAVRLALLESPSYQTELEDLYLSAARRIIRAIPVRLPVLWIVGHIVYSGW